MTQYQYKEVLDILFRKEDRITAGVSLPEKSPITNNLVSAFTLEWSPDFSLARALQELEFLGFDQKQLDAWTQFIFKNARSFLFENAGHYYIDDKLNHNGAISLNAKTADYKTYLGLGFSGDAPHIFDRFKTELYDALLGEEIPPQYQWLFETSSERPLAVSDPALG